MNTIENEKQTEEDVIGLAIDLFVKDCNQNKNEKMCFDCERELIVGKERIELIQVGGKEKYLCTSCGLNNGVTYE